jgi:hypothetical protein
VLATGLLDELSRLQDATRTSMQKLDQSNGWSHEVKLEVPQTGVSLGEISRLPKGALRARCPCRRGLCRDPE